jgi:hypothetical protein
MMTRRGALAALLTGVAGCGGRARLGDDDPTADAAALRRAASGPVPSVPDRIPVGVGDDHLAASERRARTLLDAVPDPLDADAIPNGAIRERVQGAVEGAGANLADAASAGSPVARLTALAAARADARFAAAAWGAVDAGLTQEDAAAGAADVRAARRRLRERWRYVGDDPVAAAVVHAAVERRLNRAGAVDSPRARRYREGNPLGVGEVAEGVERGRVAVADAGHLYDRLLATTEGSTDRRPRLVSARRRLREAFETARADVDTGDPEGPWTADGADVPTVAERALENLFRPMDPRHDDGWQEDDPALAVVQAHGAFVALGAFRSLRARVRDGDVAAVRSADDVATHRTAAVEAIRATDRAPGVAALTRGPLADLARRVGNADAGLQDGEGLVPVGALVHDVASYLRVAAEARALPAASERVAAALRSA